jgi:hypothetical protein
MKTLIAITIASLYTGIAVGAGVNPPTACATIYDPVCGTLHGVKKNYSNTCLAEQAGATDITKGFCERSHKRKKK